jgi:hypothetical protein
MPTETTDVLHRLDDLLVQATTERSHFYTASVLKELRAEIVLMRQCILSSLDCLHHGDTKTARRILAGSAENHG